MAVFDLTQCVALYHGTTKDFVYRAHVRAQRLASGSRSDPLYVSQSFSSAVGYAVDRARSYRSAPVVVVVALDRVRDRIFEEGSQLHIEYIAADEGIFYQFSGEKRMEPDVIREIGDLFRRKFGVFPQELVVPVIEMRR